MGDITYNKQSGKLHEEPKLRELSKKYKFREGIKLLGDKKFYDTIMDMTPSEVNNFVDAIPKTSKLPF